MRGKILLKHCFIILLIFFCFSIKNVIADTVNCAPGHAFYPCPCWPGETKVETCPDGHQYTLGCAWYFNWKHAHIDHCYNHQVPDPVILNKCFRVGGEAFCISSDDPRYYDQIFISLLERLENYFPADGEFDVENIISKISQYYDIELPSGPVMNLLDFFGVKVSSSYKVEDFYWLVSDKAGADAFAIYVPSIFSPLDIITGFNSIFFNYDSISDRISQCTYGVSSEDMKNYFVDGTDPDYRVSGAIKNIIKYELLQAAITKHEIKHYHDANSNMDILANELSPLHTLERRGYSEADKFLIEQKENPLIISARDIDTVRKELMDGYFIDFYSQSINPSVLSSELNSLHADRDFVDRLKDIYYDFGAGTFQSIFDEYYARQETYD